MLAIIAAILFLLALIFELAKTGGDVLNSTTLTTAGLLFVALHLAGALGWGTRYRRRR
jgi:ABC-type transport system involved in cytochrome c biogenesis permease component